MLEMWTIYERPRDFPAHYVLRRLWAGRGIVYARFVGGLYDTLDQARADVPAGLHNLGRDPGDDPAIRETWV